jgi:DNA-binding NtrC family response regulator
MVSSVPHILIVEDENDVREFLVRATRRFAPQAEITAVANGVEALHVFYLRRCDLIISDQRMPQMTGVELLQAVRASSSEVPFVVISADTTAEVAALHGGATAFFYKPVTIVQISQIVESLLE